MTTTQTPKERMLARLAEQIVAKRQEIKDHEIRAQDLALELKDLERRRNLIEGARVKTFPSDGGHAVRPSPTPAGTLRELMRKAGLAVPDEDQLVRMLGRGAITPQLVLENAGELAHELAKRIRDRHWDDYKHETFRTIPKARRLAYSPEIDQAKAWTKWARKNGFAFQSEAPSPKPSSPQSSPRSSPRSSPSSSAIRQRTSA